MSTSSIEWTDKTWNPTVGCSKVSAGCKNCYAETMHARLTGMRVPKYAEPFTVVKPWPAHLAEPLRWKKPARIFVNSMSDLFHGDVDDEYIAAVFGVMAACPQHTFQVLTKRAERLPRWFGWAVARGNQQSLMHECVKTYMGYDNRQRPAVNERRWPLPNVWIGVSVENQEQADARIPHLLNVPAAVRFLSCEPLLGPVTLHPGILGCVGHLAETFGNPLIHWVIVGGESGHGARIFDCAHARKIVEQCQVAGVAVFVKQLGACAIDQDNDGIAPLVLRNRKGGDPAEWPTDLRVREYPEARS